MSEGENQEKPLAVQLAEAGVEDADAIAAAVQAEQGNKSDTVGRFLSNTSPYEIADAAGSLLASLGAAAGSGQNQRPPTQATGEAEPARAATDGGDEMGGSPMRKEAMEEMEESDDGDGDETEVNDEG
jgi:hypothetical protein